MDPATSAGIGAGVEVSNSIIEWYDRAKRFFSDFKPEAQSMSINFAQQTSKILFKMAVPSGWRRKRRKLVLPAYGGFAVTSMVDSALNDHRHLWKNIGQEYVLDARCLPMPDTYLVTMEGRMDKDSLDRFVYIKPAAGYYKGGYKGRYWLRSGIRSPAMFRRVYTDLEIDDVSFGVPINVSKMFSVSIPPELKAGDASIGWRTRATPQSRRREEPRSMQAYEPHVRAGPPRSSGSVLQRINEVTSKDVIEQYATVDRPYELVDIQPPARYFGVVPQNVTVVVRADLTLRSPFATGYLHFDAESYIERLRTELGEGG